MNSNLFTTLINAFIDAGIFVVCTIGLMVCLAQIKRVKRSGWLAAALGLQAFTYFALLLLDGIRFYYMQHYNYSSRNTFYFIGYLATFGHLVSLGVWILLVIGIAAVLSDPRFKGEATLAKP